jgi:hypothetical protein
MPVSTIARQVVEAINSFLDHRDRKQALEAAPTPKKARYQDRGAYAPGFSLVGSARPRLRAA